MLKLATGALVLLTISCHTQPKERPKRGGLFGYSTPSKGLVWPAKGRLSSKFGRRGRGFHRGIDIKGPYGAPIRAAAKGKVTVVAWKRGYGKTVVIDHGSFKTLYAHLSRVYVNRGERVDRGERIGAIGSTGNSTGPHLHFEYILRGKKRDPLAVLP